MTNDPDMFHIWTLLKEAHNDSLDNICTHPLTAEQIEEFNEDSLKWDSIPDDDKKQWEDAFYGVPDKEDLAE